MRAPTIDTSAEGCSFADRGFGPYAPWRTLPPLRVAPGAASRPRAELLVPTAGGLDDDGGFALLVHFHGAEAVRKELAIAGFAIAIAGVDAGTRSSHYERALPDEDAFGELVRSAEAGVALATGRLEAHATHVIVSSWSAGYGAVTRILAGPHPRVEALVLLDSLHASYGASGRLEHGTLADFVAAARAASVSPARGPGAFTMFLTHTAIRPEGYASTTETAALVLSELGGKELALSPDPGDPMKLESAFNRGRLFVRGYAGTTAEDHCAELRLLPQILGNYVLPTFR